MDLDPSVCYRAMAARDARFDGRFFVAVKSTGIYCRPICWARTPRRENITFYPTAAAAQAAGYRPCLRCRPECSPSSWRGTLNTVSRALALIEAGALDEGDLDALAERLGVGERHLRRLFEQHIGASPIAVAQTRRVLMAKQLIHETRLSMTDVALSSGFGSLRRFNETFRSLFGRPPSSFRRDRHGKTGPAVDLTLAYRPPYDWNALAGFLQPRAAAGVELAGPHHYARTFEIAGVPGHVEVRPALDRHRLRVSIQVPRVTAIPAVVARLRRMFDLDADPAIISAQLGEDRDLRWRVAARPGLRLPGAWDGFELAVRAILGQQVSVAAATQLASRLVTMFGRPYDASPRPEGLTHLFPTAERLRDADVAAIGMPRVRGRAIAALAEAAAGEPHLFDPGQDPAALTARLRAIPGIGDWTAQYIAMRALHDSDAFPSGDIGLQRALAKHGRRPTAEKMAARAEAWRPWRAYATLHLWTAERRPDQRGRIPHAPPLRTTPVADRSAAAGL
jgi:AraC family transcriptional regulator of adaptative response / DNA-3-methyladenine glycosylase II